jgi:hypothetical protein
MARDSNNQLVGAPLTPPIAEQTIDITHESIAGAQFPPHTRFICIKAEADCCLAFGQNPIADPNFHFIDGGERIFYGVHEGHQVAVVDSTIRDAQHGINDGER